MDPVRDDPPHALELHNLELLELKLRIRDLQAAWWQRPAVLAPLATITAAILGLIWGISSGFFDVSRRELALSKRDLEIQTRELKENRDRQSVMFHAAMTAQANEITRFRAEEATLQSEVRRLELHARNLRGMRDRELLLFQAKEMTLRAETGRLQFSLHQLRRKRDEELQNFNASALRQATTIKQLTSEEAMLRNKLYEMDRPLILEAVVPKPQLRSAPSTVHLNRDEFAVHFSGVNFGATPGRLVADQVTLCLAEHFREKNLKSRIVEWSDSSVRIVIARRLLRQMALCQSNLELWIVRKDGKLSNRITVAAPGPAVDVRASEE